MVVPCPLVDQTFGSDQTDPVVVEPWMRTEFDLPARRVIIDMEKT